MQKINKGVVVVFLIAVLALWVLYPLFENFDANGSEFVPIGHERYGLRGDLLRRSDIRKNFIRPDRQIRLSHSNGEMWESNYSPENENIHGCQKVDCPMPNGYDNMDTCWKCEGHDRCPKPMAIPDIGLHVKI